MDCNRVALCGRIVQLEALRYTPAGIPITNFRIGHVSQQMEGGSLRRAECEVSCVAVEGVALKISRLKLGDQLQVEGFLARRSLKTAQLVLHVNRIKFDIEE